MAMRKRSRAATKGMKPKKQITASQRRARRVNIEIARRARKSGKKGSSRGAGGGGQGASPPKRKADVAAKAAYKKSYKEARGFGASKSGARRIALQHAQKKGARWTYKKARTLALGLAKKHGITSKSGKHQFATGFTKALRNM